LQLSLFDQRDMASITAPDFPGERLVVCRNPDLAAERTRKREDLLAATGRDLARVQAAVARKRAPLRGAAQIGLAAGAVINTHKMAKHFDLAITDTSFGFARKTAAIAAEAATDGLYVVRTSLPAETLHDAAAVRSYKSLARVERAFRCLKTVDLQVRPVHHWLADRVRAHVLAARYLSQCERVAVVRVVKWLCVEWMIAAQPRADTADSISPSVWPQSLSSTTRSICSAFE
jgi:hypothetical protein